MWIEMSDRLHQYTGAEERQVSHAEEFQVTYVGATPSGRWNITPISEVWAAQSTAWDCGGGESPRRAGPDKHTCPR